MSLNDRILTHNLDSTDDPILLKSIDHKNQYDYTQLHRHNYFEVMFFHRGGGKNLIDFVEYDVKTNGCYIIYPGQIHLLNRAPGSKGNLIQFQRSSIISEKLQRLLQERAWSGKGAVLFEEDEILMAKVMTVVDLLGVYSNSPTNYRKESKQHLLQALLFDLCAAVNEKMPIQKMESDFYHFQKLVDKHFKEVQSVGFYINKLAISDKKLASLSKKHVGMSPLQVIHRRILLEAKRQLVFGELPHKEIAYNLGFDSPASFSAFIKKKTGLTASEIQTQVSEIHNY